MLIKIDEDLFDICKRIKEIDDGYFVVYNRKRLRYELHNEYQENTYCLTYPYEILDNRLLDIIHMSKISNIDNIIEEIDNNNKIIEQNANNDYKDVSGYMLNEIYKYANNSSKKFVHNTAFKSAWR